MAVCAVLASGRSDAGCSEDDNISTSQVLLVSSGARSGAAEVKATYRPSALAAKGSLRHSAAWPPLLSTLIRAVQARSYGPATTFCGTAIELVTTARRRQSASLENNSG